MRLTNRRFKRGIRRPDGLLPWWAVVAMDVLALGAALLVFALFHHALPRKGGAARSIVTMEDVKSDGMVSGSDGAMLPSDGMLAGSDGMAVAEPTPAPVGDFSAVFPSEDTGVGALYSYQSDALRVAVNKERDEERRITWYVADIWVKNIRSFRTAFAQGEYGQNIQDWPQNIARENNAILAVTGDFYGVRAKGIVIRNGQLYRDVLRDDVCVLYADGVMETYTEEEFDLDAAVARGAYQAWSFGPALLVNGEATEEFTSGKLADKNPRCGFGYYAPGHYCLVVIDGRQGSYSKGMTLAEMSQLFYDMGCKAAYNLDGGKTAAMFYQGETVNQPFEDGRRVSDIVYVGE